MYFVFSSFTRVLARQQKMRKILVVSFMVGIFQLPYQYASSLQTLLPLHLPLRTAALAATTSQTNVQNNNEILQFSIIPPSTNPRSKLNQACCQELQDKLHVLHAPLIESGRIRFAVAADTPSPFITWGSLLQSSGVRSVRMVPFRSDINTSRAIKDDNHNDISYNLPLVMEQIVNGTDWAATLDLWKRFGNTYDKNGQSTNDDSQYQEEVKDQQKHFPSRSLSPLYFHVKVKKMQGTVFHAYSTSHLSQQFVHAVQKNVKFGDWMIPTLAKKTSLSTTKDKTPTMEIILLLQNGTNASIEIPVLVPPSDDDSSNSQSSGSTFQYNELPHPGFKRVESWAVVKTATIQPGDVVLDPMCGRGTFLVEGAVFWPSAKSYMGIDCCTEQLNKANLNIQHVFRNRRIDDGKSCIQVRYGDACHLHDIENKSIDKIICCPPFGRQFFTVVDGNSVGNTEDINEYEKKGAGDQGMLYKQLLVEWCRVLKDDITSKMVLVIDGGTNLDHLMDAIYSTKCQVVELRTFRLGPQLRGNIVVVTKQRNKKDGKIDNPNVNSDGSTMSNMDMNYTQSIQSFRKSNKLHWELDIPPDLQQSYRDRALWSLLRSRMIPALVPACPETK